MSGRVDPRQFEALAQGVAAGLSKKAAGNAAGYSKKTNSYYGITNRPEFAARVAVLRQEQPWGATDDLAPAINMLIRTAERLLAQETITPAGFDAATRMIAEAARLKQKLRKGPAGDLGVKEWLAKFGPKS